MNGKYKGVLFYVFFKNEIPDQVRDDGSKVNALVIVFYGTK